MDGETWQVYLVECADHTLYCGVTKDTERRVAQHNGEKRGGARYTRSRRPVRLVAERSCRSQNPLPSERHNRQIMISLTTALSFFGAALMLGFAPGPDIVFVLAQSAVYGARAGLATMCGLITGLCFHTTLVTVGVAALIQASPVAFTVLKAAGAAYLIYLAWLSWRAGAMRAGKTQNAFPGYAALYRRGILMNITNPKVSIFFLAFLPQFCDPARGNVGMQCLALGIIFMLATAVAFTSVSLLAGRIFSRFNSKPEGQVIMHKICAVIFLGLAVLLLTARI